MRVLAHSPRGQGAICVLVGCPGVGQSSMTNECDLLALPYRILILPSYSPLPLRLIYNSYLQACYQVDHRRYKSRRLSWTASACIVGHMSMWTRLGGGEMRVEGADG
eukprot:TRINITY_DN8315_c0_g1_i14.p1 TRINITY_DN8315_c0_g1~~TRINITY_DN8315_c0_g1_i14.p1  ORF type:complete len:107 (-),score=10.68 TRINITY_DN8315_c0_g1_i14:169-489(-)